MEDILYDTAIKYKEMLGKGYDIIVGRKGKSYRINLRFSMDSFFHLVGLQHLTDLTYSSKNKERIYKDILEKKLTVEHIKKSVFYEKWYIEERIIFLPRLEEILDSCQFLFRINPKEYIKYTTIYADYLCKYILPEDIESHLYFFSVKAASSHIEDEYRGCSFFKGHEIDYTRGTSETKLLLNVKLSNVKPGMFEQKELFRHQNYTETI